MALPVGDLVAVDGIRCTSATRTIIDCAALLGDEALEAAFEQARRMGLTSPALLAKRGERTVRARTARLRTRSGVCSRCKRDRARWSRGSRCSWRVCSARARCRGPSASIPSGATGSTSRGRRGRVACECDGFEHHGSRLAWKRDRGRLAVIEAAGWRIVHVTWNDVTYEPDQTLDRLLLALRELAA